jgi:subtilisin family serine protease
VCELFKKGVVKIKKNLLVVGLAVCVAVSAYILWFGGSMFERLSLRHSTGQGVTIAVLDGPSSSIHYKKVTDVIRNVAPNVRFISIPILNERGYGDARLFIQALERCLTEKVQIVNISAGLSRDDPLIQRAIMQVVNKHIFVVAAAGNSFGGEAQFPARYSHVLSVGALEKDEQPAFYSAQGKVDIFAPEMESMNGGTSIATAYVSGLLARIFEHRLRSNSTTEPLDRSQVIDLLNTHIKKEIRS